MLTVKKEKRLFALGRLYVRAGVPIFTPYARVVARTQLAFAVERTTIVPAFLEVPMNALAIDCALGIAGLAAACFVAPHTGLMSSAVLSIHFQSSEARIIGPIPENRL